MKVAATTAISGRSAHSPAGERPFRPTLGARKSPTAGGGGSFLRAVSILVSKQGGRRSGVSTRSDRGGGRTFKQAHPAWQYSQRVIVKARVVRNRGATGQAMVRDHINYVERDGVDEEGGKGRSFGMEDYLTDDEVDAFVERTAEDRHHFRFIVSPEKAGEMDLATFTRELMLQVEADLGTELDWVAVEHHNTDNPHVHIVLRGVDDRGADLVIGRDYISQGLRARGQEIATRELGPRREEEIDQERAAELHADRATRLDRVLAAEASEAQGIIDVRPSRERVGFRERQRVEKITRLHHLESLGLADEIKSGRWEIDPDAVAKLTHLAHRAVLAADLTRLAGERFEYRDISVYDKTAPPGEIIQGEIVGRARPDELAERDVLFIAANAGPTAGEVYRVALSGFAEAAAAPIRRGQIVNLSIHQRKAVTAADRIVVEQAKRDGGLYSEERHLQWTKAVNRQRASPIDDIDAYMEHHVKRLEGHERRGLVEKIRPGIWRVPADLIENLEAFAHTQRDTGFFPVITPVSSLTVDAQVPAIGPTWLDQHLSRGEHLVPARTASLTAERRLRTALLHRAQELEGRGHRVHRQALAAADIESLYEAEIAQTAQRLNPIHGRHLPLAEIRASGIDRQRRLEGTLASVEDLASGPHAILVNGKGFAMVPATARTHEHIGKTMTVTLRAPEVLDPSRPQAVQLRVRFSERERERERDLGRSR